MSVMDPTFERDGVKLGEWLMRLVSEDRATREAASARLDAMHWGIISKDVELEGMDPGHDLEAHGKKYAAAIRDAIAAEGFDGAEFVRRLCVYRVAASDDWLRRVDKRFKGRGGEDKQWERIADKLVPRLNSGNEAVRNEANRRFVRSLCASFARDGRADKEAFEGAEAMSSAAMSASVVFDAIDQAFLMAPEAFRLVLEHEQESRHAIAALIRIGKTGGAFAPYLVDVTDGRKGPNGIRCDFQAAQALGAVGAGDGGIVDLLVARLRQQDPEFRNGAALALTTMGKDLAGRQGAVLTELLNVLGLGENVRCIVGALASIGGDDPQIRRRVLDMARPRPAVLEPYPDYPSMTFDRVMLDRGPAIDAMARLTAYPQECVPILSEAIDSFVEYDSDQGYFGPVARIANVLMAFGPNAAPAAAKLASRLDDEGAEYPKAIIKALISMGPAARAVLPQLERHWARLLAANPDMKPSDSPPDRVTDPLRWLIESLQGNRE
ncbi:MAG: hypothetical protein NTW19_24030 [Planctomycetota bacterium]|nr:hypothetical protein [Planctomycetota bacterium]